MASIFSDEESPLLEAPPHQHQAESRAPQLPLSQDHASLSWESSKSSGSDDITPPRPTTSPATLSSSATPAERAILFLGIFLVGYAYGLESQVRSAYQPYATDSFSLHPYLSTINVLRSVVSVASQPTAAKIADIFGRFEVAAAATILYVAGTAVEACAGSVEVFCAGAIVYQVGYTCLVLLTEVLVADFSSMRARVFFSYLPALPFLINTWISGSVSSAVLRVTTWRWGLGMWAIIYPLTSIPLLVTLYRVERRFIKEVRNPLRGLSIYQLSAKLSDLLDLTGLVSLVAAFSLILAPLTVVGSDPENWRHPSILAPLTLGLLCVPAFILWERWGAVQPLIPFSLLADRGVWSALAVRMLLNLAWSIQGTYLYTVLVVAFDFSIESATRILSLFSFFGVLSGVLIGLVIYRLRRLKTIIIGGTFIFMLAFWLLVQYPGDPSAASRTGLVGAQILLGLASGFFAYPTQASIQASASREHVAILTGLYLSFYNIGTALGTCVAGVIWTQLLYPILETNLAFQPDPSLARAAYDSPFSVVAHYAVGTDIRTAIITSYQHVQRLLCMVGLGICVPMIAFSFILRNPRLSENQIQSDAESESE